ADDPRPAAQRHPRPEGFGAEDRGLRPAGEHDLRADLPGPERGHRRGRRAARIPARPSDAVALALRTRAPIFVEDTVIDNAKTVDFTTEKADADRLHNWLEMLDTDDRTQE